MRILILTTMLLLISGCASGRMTYPLPKCNGYAKRALNKSMWDWQQNAPSKSPALVSNFAQNSRSSVFAPIIGSEQQMLAEQKSYENCE